MIVLAVVAYALPYLLRTRTLRGKGRPVPRARQASFAAGLGALVLAAAAGTRDDRSLLAHMAEHVLLADLAPLLLVLGCTGPVLAPVLRVPALRRLAAPAPALALWAVTLYGWHVPAAYDAAATNPVLHALQHACFVGAGATFWFALLGPLTRASVGVRLAAVTAWWTLGSAIGAVLVFASAPVYAPYPDVGVQSAAGALMMVEQATLALAVFSGLFLILFPPQRTAR